MKSKGPSPDQIEALRICSLPILPEMSEEEHEQFCAEEMLAESFDRGDRFLRPQAGAIRAYREAAGGFFPIGVGFGKTGVCLAIANIAHRQGLRKSLLFIPPQVLDQFMLRDVPFWRRRIPFPILRPWCLGGIGRAARARIAASNRPGLYVMPYSLLSQPDAVDLIASIRPQLVIGDEAHLLQNPRAARTKRLLAYLNETQPQFVAMSGSITAKSVMDYHHLVTLSLRDRSPLPRSGSMAYFWGQLLASSTNEVSGDTPARFALMPVMKWAKQHFPAEKFDDTEIESYRRAYRHRLVTAPGVVATSDADIGVSLTIENDKPIQAPNAALVELIAKANKYQTPNGDPIDHAIHIYKWLYELSSGFYNQLSWPTQETLTKAGRTTDDLERAKDHHTLTSIYHKHLREFFKTSPPGLDTPMMVGLEANRAQPRLPEELLNAYRMMRNAQTENMVERESRAVLVDAFKINHAAAWAIERHDRGAILWVWHQVMGQWLVKALREAGLDPAYAPAGANELICDPESGKRIVVASIAAHGTGKNLQHFQEQLVVQWPRDCRTAEQLIGRTHRTGQAASELTVTTNRSLPFDHVNFAACLNDAIYVQQTLGMRQKIIYCNHAPLPEIFSPEFLREQGASPDMLNAEQRAMMKELFGSS